MKLDALKRRPTQADVARLAKVSQAMVSYVLNDNGTIAVPAETRQRILDAIAELGYVPNTAARSLRTRKSYSIAAVIPDITNPFYPAFARGIQDVAQRHGYDLMLYNTDGQADQEQKCLHALRRGQVDGVILMLFHPPLANLRALQELNIAVALLGNEPGIEYAVDSASIDNVAAAEAAVAYLLKRGHRRIAMVAGVEDTHPRRNRVRGYHQALAAAGIAPNELLIRGGDFTEQGGYQATRELLRLEPRPSAIFAANDLMAIGAIAAIREAGLQVPNDIAVVGFDDIPAARLVTPALTTVSQFEQQVGRRLAELLIERLEGKAPETPRHEEMPFELIIRASA